MKGKIATLAALLAVVALVAGPAHAGSQTATYVTFNNNILAAQITGCTPPEVPVPRTCPAGNVGIGGFGFAKTATVPLTVKVVDQSGPEVGFTACQDLNGNHICGEGGEPRIDTCSSSTARSLTGFKANVSVSVFVFTVSTNCEGIGTTGTITVTN